MNSDRLKEWDAQLLGDTPRTTQRLGHALSFIGSTEVFAVRMSLWRLDEA